MTTNRSADAKKIDLVKLKYWFGPPPLDLGDDERAFDDYVCELAKCMEPRIGSSKSWSIDSGSSPGSK